jgi:ABC-type Fe3+ transport system permease subunit
MYRSLFNRRERRRRGGYESRRGRRWPRSRAGGCLLWIVLLIVILIVLSVLFGGFQKGTKAGSLGHSCTSCTSAPIAAGPTGLINHRGH